MKSLSLLALTLQNSLLTILLHLSRTLPDNYSAPLAVLLSELLKAIISFTIATTQSTTTTTTTTTKTKTKTSISQNIKLNILAIFSRDCWKLSIPAVLYVLQNNLQFVAASHLDLATFSVTYQLKILTTALCSVLILRRRLSSTKWIALLFLAIGVGLVQLENVSQGTVEHHPRPGSRTVGFVAVLMACLTSGLAGVYFELVLKSSTKVDLWIRNVQLSLFSLPPALFTALASADHHTGLFAHFGAWAWATVAVQVLGGLLTALVIKFADNILKGFATSLSIILSTLAGVFLFGDPLPLRSALGASIVLLSTYFYNLHDPPSPDHSHSHSHSHSHRAVLPTSSKPRPTSLLPLPDNWNIDRHPSTVSILLPDPTLDDDEKPSSLNSPLLRSTTPTSPSPRLAHLSLPSPRRAHF